MPAWPALTSTLNAAALLFHFKVVNDRARYNRCGAGVLYFPKSLRREVLKLVADVYSQTAKYLRDRTPGFTKRLAPGLAKVAAENKRWHENPTDLAKFLHGANPKNWPESSLQSALFMHLDQTINEATHQLKGDYAASIKDYDAAMDHMLMVADIPAKGIEAQFPSKFSNK